MAARRVAVDGDDGDGAAGVDGAIDGDAVILARAADGNAVFTRAEVNEVVGKIVVGCVVAIAADEYRFRVGPAADRSPLRRLATGDGGRKWEFVSAEASFVDVLPAT